jgi:ubiquinone/menaquinone biosynthesis C-methylase UbiE
MVIAGQSRPERMAHAFDALAPGYDHVHHDAVAQALLAFAGPSYQGAAADVACGGGAVALALAQLRQGEGAPGDLAAGDARVLAVDLSPQMIEVGRARAAQAGLAGAIEWRVGSALPLPVPDASLDLILCASSLHFLGAAALHVWRRALRDGGRAAFTLPLASAFRASGAFAELVAEDLTLPSDAASARALAVEAGFADARAVVEEVNERQIALVVSRA